MKKLILLTVFLGVLPLSMIAQDDLYFVPKKASKVQQTVVSDNTPAYHIGSDRNVDEYNRRGKFGSYFEKIGTDSLGNDIIEFHSSAEDLTDSLKLNDDYKYDAEEDYAYSRRMSRFDDYYLYDPWFYRYYGFGPYWRHYAYYGYYYPWYDPWYYSWYGGWYDPWFYGWYGGWYDPWYYGRYNGWYGGYYSYSPRYSYGSSRNYGSGGITGSSHHGAIAGGYSGSSKNIGRGPSRSGNFGGYRGNGQTTSAYNRTHSSRGSGTYRNSSRGSSTYTPSGSSITRGSFGSPSYSSGGSYSGGSRSSGGGSFSSGGGGGSRSSGGGGGGHFGGSRR